MNSSSDGIGDCGVDCELSGNFPDQFDHGEFPARTSAIA